MIHDGMNRAVICGKGCLMRRRWANFLWEKKILLVSHQGVLWAQKPWFCCWEWPGNGDMKRNQDQSWMFATEWASTLGTSFLPVTLSICPETMELAVL